MGGSLALFVLKASRRGVVASGAMHPSELAAHQALDYASDHPDDARRREGASPRPIHPHYAVGKKVRLCPELGLSARRRIRRWRLPVKRSAQIETSILDRVTRYAEGCEKGGGCGAIGDLGPKGIRRPESGVDAGAEAEVAHA